MKNEMLRILIFNFKIFFSLYWDTHKLDLKNGGSFLKTERIKINFLFFPQNSSLKEKRAKKSLHNNFFHITLCIFVFSLFLFIFKKTLYWRVYLYENV